MTIAHILSLKTDHTRDTSAPIVNQWCIYGPFSTVDWKLGDLGYKRYACPTSIPHNYCTLLLTPPPQKISFLCPPTLLQRMLIRYVCLLLIQEWFSDFCYLKDHASIHVQPNDGPWRWSQARPCICVVTAPPPHLWEEDGDHQSRNWQGSIWSMQLSKVLDFLFRAQDWGCSSSELSIFEAFPSRLTISFA